MKFNIIIPTRNLQNVSLIRKILLSGIPLNKMIIIDDSTKENSRKIIEKIKDNYKDKIILVKKSLIKNKMEPFKLGTPFWNLGNTRNLGIFTSMAYGKNCSATIFLDDDIEIKKYPLEKIETIYRGKMLGKIKILGSPDLSRLEWIELYLKTRNPKLKSNNKYVEKIYSVCGKNSNIIIKKYTNLKTQKTKNTSLILPQRNELSGGAFIISNRLLGKVLFSNWFDEDWQFFDKYRNSFKVKEIETKIEVFHKSKKKKILNKSKLIFEEKGKIMTNYFKEHGERFKTDYLLRIINKRISILKEISEKFKKIGNKNITDKFILDHLKFLINYLKKAYTIEIIDEMKKFHSIERRFLKHRTHYLNKIKEILDE